MDTKQIRLSYPSGETPANIFPDFEWIRENRQMLLDKFGICVVLVYEKTIIGRGATLEAALSDAEQNLSSLSGVITPVTYFLAPLDTFSRIRLAASEQS